MHAVLVVATIHETTVVSVVLDERLDFLPNCGVQIVTRFLLNLDAHSAQESLDESLSFGLIVELQLDGNA